MGTRGSGSGYKKRIVVYRIVGRPAASFIVVVELGGRTPACEREASIAKGLDRFGSVRVTWITEGIWAGDSVLLALRIDVVDVGPQFFSGLFGHARVGSRMVSDFESHRIEFGDFLPRTCSVTCPSENSSLR